MALLLVSAQSFAVSTTMRSSPKSLLLTRSTMLPMTQNHDHDTDFPTSVAESKMKPESLTAKSSQGIKLQSLKPKGPFDVDQAFHHMDVLSDYGTRFMGLILLIGFVLNLNGYGYQLTDHGIDIDTIQHIRERHDFHMEILRMTK
jgi:hypothetical protein